VSAIALRVLPAISATEVRFVGFFPDRRISCVGRSYLDHIRGMRAADECDSPFFSLTITITPLEE
jgi:fumarylpyruvate hydrolase